MNLGFVTCVQLGLSCMEAIYQSGGTLSLAITLTDEQARNKSGRVYLDDFCSERGVPLIKSRHINDNLVIEAIKKHSLDWLFIIGWSQIANQSLLDAPKKGVLGIHPTLLPKGRGRAAIPWAILKRLPETGVSLFKLDAGVDTGPVAAQIKIPLSTNTTATELYRLADQAHIELIKSVIPRVLNEGLTLIEQDNSAATIWPGRSPEDGEINLSGSVWDAECLVRAVTRPYPGAFVKEKSRKTTVWAAEKESVEPEGLSFKFSDGYLRCLDWKIENE